MDVLGARRRAVEVFDTTFFLNSAQDVSTRSVFENTTVKHCTVKTSGAT